MNKIDYYDYKPMNKQNNAWVGATRKLKNELKNKNSNITLVKKNSKIPIKKKNKR